jgi:acetylornithine deacetylase/succinyl-diaminopimelate desuccinylase-like protein
MSLSVKDLLRQLLAIPSINPAFQATDPNWVGEGCLTDFLENWVSRQGWRWLRQEVHPGRDNLVALIPTTAETVAENVTLCEVHQDTVGVTGMQIDPFAAHEQQGRMFGRGACDVKGGMAAMLTALSQVSQAKTNQATILLALSVNEECGFTGAKALCRLWKTGHPWDQQFTAEEKTRGTLSLEELRRLQPQRAIVAEPTDLHVVATHKGLVRWLCHAHGRAAHSSQPQEGKNAIYDMTEVVRVVQEYDREVLSKRGLDCMCGRPTVSVNTIHGGTGANVVPDHCVIDIDRRLMPGEVPGDAHQELIEFIAAKISKDSLLEHEPPWNQSLGMQVGENRGWAEEVAKAASFDGRVSEIVGVPYGTDAWVFASIGIPTVVIGPGSIAQAHTEDEWISVDELERGVEVYRRIACLLGNEDR